VPDEDAERRARAAARRPHIVLRKTTLAEGEHDLSPVRGADAVSLVTRLSITSWSLGGRPLPSYSRREIPCRFVARGSR
jgi:hypothetical protein